MGDSADLKVGAWTVATGHPGGWDDSRPGVVRLGRIIRADSFVVQSDCTLVGGDSGGPLFDMQGRVIGIHSRIGSLAAANFHVPVDTYQLTWDRLKRGDAWGEPEQGGPFLGVNGSDHPLGCRITQVVDDTPADKGGLRRGDVVLIADGEPIRGYAGFVELIGMTKPGAKMDLRVRRGERSVNLTVEIGERPESQS
jgi:serine protease Do